MKKSTVLFTALLTTTFLVSCAGTKTTTEITGNQEVVSIEGELTDLANKEYPKDFYGVGQATSTKERIAGDQAELAATGDLAASVTKTFKAKRGETTTNSADEEGLDVYGAAAVQKVSTELSNVRIQKRRTTYNKETGKYTVYVLVTVPKADVSESLKRSISQEKTETVTRNAAELLQAAEKMVE